MQPNLQKSFVHSSVKGTKNLKIISCRFGCGDDVNFHLFKKKIKGSDFLRLDEIEIVENSVRLKISVFQVSEA